MNASRVASRCIMATLIAVLGISACGSKPGTADRAAGTSSLDGQEMSESGLPSVESLSGWEAGGDAIVVGTVMNSTRVPTDKGSPHRTYADRLQIRIDKVLWKYESSGADIAQDGIQLSLFGQQWRKTDAGDFVPADDDITAVGQLTVGKQFVASIVAAPPGVETNFDVYPIRPSTVIPIVDGLLQPAPESPKYASDLDGASIARFASILESVSVAKHVDPWSPGKAGTPSTTR